MVAGLAVAGVPLWGEQLTAGQVPLCIGSIGKSGDIRIDN